MAIATPGGGDTTAPTQTTAQTGATTTPPPAAVQGYQLSPEQIAAIAYKAGFRGQGLQMAVAIALAESSGVANAWNTAGNSAGTDRGLWQINDYYHSEVSDAQAYNPLAAAEAAFRISNGGTNWSQWATFTNGAFHQHMTAAQQGVTGMSKADITKIPTNLQPMTVNGQSPPQSNASGVGPVTTTGAGAGQMSLTPQEIQGELNGLGFPKALIQSDKNLKHVFDEIVSQGIDLSTDAGKARAIEAFKSTPWWKKRSDSQRKFDVLQYDNPGEFNREIAQKQKDLQALSTELGINLSPNDLSAMSRLILRNGMDDAEVRSAMAGHFQYNPQNAVTGQAGTDVNALQDLAGKYYVNLGKDTIQNMVQRMITGDLSPESLTEYFKQQAISRFPHLQQQINSGLTVADVADPYKQEMANLLEMDPNGIKPQDPTILKGLQASTPEGGFQLMPLWQYQNMLRQDPRWSTTDNARNSLLGTAGSVLRELGVSS